MTDFELNTLLANEGFTTIEAQRAARQAIEDAGLTRSRKMHVSGVKLPRIRMVLEEQFVKTCPHPVCRELIERRRKGRRVVVVAYGDCELCEGSDNLRAARRFVVLANGSRTKRVVVVGGSPSTRGELDELRTGGIELRLVDGTARTTGERAERDLEWADVVLVWGSTQLDHKVSALYTDPRGPYRRKVVSVARRGVAALLDAGAEHIERGTTLAGEVGA